MLDLSELEQLVAFSDMGTLSKVADSFHISTPSITRSMQNLEENFGVQLFTRSKNKIELNETGKFAVEHAKRLLYEAEQTLKHVREFDQRQKTIIVKSCAPAPLWTLMHRLSEKQPGMTISSSICQNEEVAASWADGSCDIAILPFPIHDNHGTATLFMHENLFVCVPPDHELAKCSELTFSQINGFNFLLRSELGFWDTLCRRKMPASKFLVQPDEFTFNELVAYSSLPCFVTDYISNLEGTYPGRITIPLADDEAKVTFYFLSNSASPLFYNQIKHE